MKYKMDSLLVHLARAGDEDACEKLVKKYYPSIYQYCLLHINDPYGVYESIAEAGADGAYSGGLTCEVTNCDLTEKGFFCWAGRRT